MTVQPSTFDCGAGEPWALEFFRRLCRGHEARRASWRRARAADDDQLVTALVKLAAGLSGEERAVLGVIELRGDEDPGERLARDHGWHDGRLAAMRGLARSRGIGLERTIRAAMAGELRNIIALPPVERRETATNDEERYDR